MKVECFSSDVSYFQACLSFPQSIGIIGGKPNHAHWFLGYMGKYQFISSLVLVYLILNISYSIIAFSIISMYMYWNPRIKNYMQAIQNIHKICELRFLFNMCQYDHVIEVWYTICSIFEKEYENYLFTFIHYRFLIILPDKK